jgi:hypothetical protein
VEHSTLFSIKNDENNQHIHCGLFISLRSHSKHLVDVASCTLDRRIRASSKRHETPVANDGTWPGRASMPWRSLRPLMTQTGCASASSAGADIRLTPRRLEPDLKVVE